MNPIGVMQGRLSPPVSGRIQAFPWTTWEMEFDRARECGFASIEWLFEAERYRENPIWTDDGPDRIHRRIEHSGVQVRSLCADYFMLHPFFRCSDAERRESVDVLERLVVRSAMVGIEVILIPVLEVSEIRDEAEKRQLLDSLARPLDLAMDLGIRVGLETELRASEYRELIERADHPALGAYYDVGNATAKGYDIAEDVRVLRDRICGCHIKDRKVGGTSVSLGRGDADFAGVFEAFAATGFSGSFVLQTAFGPDFMRDAKTHLDFVRDALAASRAPSSSPTGARATGSSASAA